MILDDDGRPLVPVHECWTDSEAEIVVSALRAHAIQAVTNSEVPRTVLPFTVDGLGKIQILVREEAQDDALRILEALPEAEDPQEDEPAVE